MASVTQEAGPALELLPAGPDDRYFDYCLEPYAPRRPTAGKLRAENLLWRSLEVAGCLSAFHAPLKAVQAHLGRDLTVWGVKFDGSRLWWELYFYDPAKEDAAATATALSRALEPYLRIAPKVRESIPYMMVSFDLYPDSFERGSVEVLNLYLTGTSEHAGRSYTLDRSGFSLQNTYRFMGPKTEIDRVLPLLKSSVFVDYGDPRKLAQVLLPQLFACKKVCVAKKRSCDAVYFSGIDVSRLLWFLRRFGYPAPLVDFVAAQREGFEHLWFDVGIDYRDDEDGNLVYLKTSFYGTL